MHCVLGTVEYGSSTAIRNRCNFILVKEDTALILWVALVLSLSKMSCWTEVEAMEFGLI